MANLNCSELPQVLALERQDHKLFCTQFSSINFQLWQWTLALSNARRDLPCTVC